MQSRKITLTLAKTTEHRNGTTFESEPGSSSYRLYVRKSDMTALGNPDQITVTIAAKAAPVTATVVSAA